MYQMGKGLEKKVTVKVSLESPISLSLIGWNKEKRVNEEIGRSAPSMSLGRGSRPPSIIHTSEIFKTSEVWIGA